jgi:hypothetical protein
MKLNTFRFWTPEVRFGSRLALIGNNKVEPKGNKKSGIFTALERREREHHVSSEKVIDQQSPNGKKSIDREPVGRYRRDDSVKGKRPHSAVHEEKEGRPRCHVIQSVQKGLIRGLRV